MQINEFYYIVNIFSLLNKYYPRLTFNRKFADILTNLFIHRKRREKKGGKERENSSSVFDLLPELPVCSSK
jgi:hypothetical protein